MTGGASAGRRAAEWILTGVLLLGGLLCLVPILSILAGAFLPEGDRWFAAIRAAYVDPARLLTLAGNTARVTIGTVSVAALFGIPAGFLCFRTDLPLRRAWIAVAWCAVFVPAYVTVTAWMAWAGMHPWLYSTAAAAWLGGIALAPVVMLVSGVCFVASARRDLEDAARLEYTGWRVFCRVVLPGSVWGVAVAVLAAGVLALWDVTITDILVVRTFAEEVLTQFQLGCGPQQAAAIALPVLALGLLLVVAAASLLSQPGGIRTGSRGPAAPPIQLGWTRGPWFVFLLSVSVAVFLVPLGYLVRTAGGPGRILQAWRIAGPELMRTVLLAPMAATLCLPLAAAVGWRLARPGWARWPVLAAVVVWLVTPSPLVGIGLAEWLNRPEIPLWLCDSYAGVLLAWVIRAIPFCALLLMATFRQLPQTWLDLAALESGGWLFLFRQVVLPHARRALAAAWLLGVVLCMGEIGATFLVVPPGRTTLTIRFFTLIHYGVYPDAAGICLLLLAFVLVPIVGILYFTLPGLGRVSRVGVDA